MASRKQPTSPPPGRKPAPPPAPPEKMATYRLVFHTGQRHPHAGGEIVYEAKVSMVAPPPDFDYKAGAWHGPASGSVFGAIVAKFSEKEA